MLFSFSGDKCPFDLFYSEFQCFFALTHISSFDLFEFIYKVHMSQFVLFSPYFIIAIMFIQWRIYVYIYHVYRPNNWETRPSHTRRLMIVFLEFHRQIQQTAFFHKNGAVFLRSHFAWICVKEIVRMQRTKFS